MLLDFAHKMCVFAMRMFSVDIYDNKTDFFLSAGRYRNDCLIGPVAFCIYRCRSIGFDSYGRRQYSVMFLLGRNL